MIVSAGTLLYRRNGDQLEVLIVHASGYRHGPGTWSIPKGHPTSGEDLETAARRETLEETGVVDPDRLTPLGFVAYRSGKRVYSFAGEVGEDVLPRCESWEVDAVEFVAVEEAIGKLNPAQRGFVGRASFLVGWARRTCIAARQ